MITVERAPRFPVNLTMRYRVAGERNWLDGQVLNMSATGVLFHGTCKLKQGTKIEIFVDLPGMWDCASRPKIAGAGVIVRSPFEESTDDGGVLAAKLIHSKIVRARLG